MCESVGVTKPRGVVKAKVDPRGRLRVGSRVVSVRRGALPARLVRNVGEAEQERTRWDPKDGELCPSQVEARGNSDGGPKRF